MKQYIQLYVCIVYTVQIFICISNTIKWYSARVFSVRLVGDLCVVHDSYSFQGQATVLILLFFFCIFYLCVSHSISHPLALSISLSLSVSSHFCFYSPEFTHFSSWVCHISCLSDIECGNCYDSFLLEILNCLSLWLCYRHIGTRIFFSFSFSSLSQCFLTLSKCNQLRGFRSAFV